MSKAAPRLNIWQQTAYSLPQVGINLMGVMLAEWLTFFYRPAHGDGVPLVGAGVFGALMVLGRLADGVSDPLIGHWSDRTRSRYGRRMPFIILGTPLMALTFLGLWFPPDPTATFRNVLYLGGTLMAYWVAFTVVVGPYYALLPEIAATTKERVRLSSVMALFTAVGALGAGIGVGQLQSANPDGLTVMGVHFSTGIQAFAVFASLATVASFILMPAGIREQPHSVAKEIPAGLFDGLRTAYKNEAFRCFLGLAVLVQLGTLTFITGLPYLCTTVLERFGVSVIVGPIRVVVSEPGLIGPGQGEAWTGTLQAILFGIALLSIPLVNALSERIGKNRLMMMAGWTFSLALGAMPFIVLFPDPTVPVLVVVSVLGFPASCALVLVNAIAADVVDYDEERTGLRREGIYAGASALVAKTAQGLGPAIVVLLLAWFGDSRANPVGILMIGPVSAGMIALGTWIFSKSPLR